MNLIILSALPPPRGGVSTHIERLLPYLEKTKIKFVVWDHSRIRKKQGFVISLRREPVKVLLSLWRHAGVKVLYCPLSRITAGKSLFLLFMKIIGIRITATLAASPEQTLGHSFLNQAFLLALARFSSHIIAANEDFRKLLIDKGISEDKISVIPAFIPSKHPSIEKLPIPQDAVDFCNKCNPLIITYAYGPDLHKGEDLYGLDLMVQLAQELRTGLPQAGFVVVIPEVTNENYINKIRNNIRSGGLEPFFYFAIGNHISFIPFLQYADLFIRATNTDGDALTLREALYYGVPSIASNVAPRPEGTILFRNRDIQDLSRAVRENLNTTGGNKNHSSRFQRVNNAELLINVFKNVAG